MALLGFKTISGGAERRDRTASLYARDFHAWTVQQAERLRARAQTDRADDIDWANAAEEIESLGARERREIRTRMTLVLQHLLKWRFQPSHRSDSWRLTLLEQRDQIAELLEDSPSLAVLPAEALDRAYARAVRAAANETKLSEATFPDICPFTLDQILDPNFLPETA